MFWFLKNTKGFTLIESAGVMGILAVIIVGAWMAIETMQENRKIETSSTQTALIVQNIRNLYKGNTISGLSSFSTDNMVRAKVFPQNMMNGNTPQTPWRTPIQLRATSSTAFSMTFSGLQQKTCRLLAQKYLNQLQTTGGPRSIAVDGNTITNMSASAFANGCSSVTVNFNLR